MQRKTDSPIRVRAGAGRPQKFGRPSRAVALTLPEDVIKALGALDDDLARAVVRLTQPLVAETGSASNVELSQHHDDAVIVIKPVKALEGIPGVTLVPLPDSRALISLNESMSIFEFELKLLDAIHGDHRMPASETGVLSSIAEILKHARQTKGISLHKRSIIVLKVRGRRRISTRGHELIKSKRANLQLRK